MKLPSIILAFVLCVASTNAQMAVVVTGGALTGSATGTDIRSTALEASHVLKASAGSLVSLSIYSSTAQYILVMNSATVPANGAVSLLFPPIKIAADSTVMVSFNAPLVATTGISVSNSSTGSFTKTLGAADCIFHAQIQ